jgi:site-specific recombinase XerD
MSASVTRPTHAPLDPLIEGYLSYLDKVGRKTARTIVDVRCTLRRAIAGLDRLRPGVDLWRLSLTDYLHWMEEERQLGRTSASLAKYVSHVRGLLEYAWRSGRTERNVLDGFSLQHTLRRCAPKHLTLEEAQQLVQATMAGDTRDRRDRLVVLLLYGCGLRTSELCALNVADINRERHELTVQKAKADRPRCIPIPEGLYTELLAYLLEHGKRGALFRTSFLERRICAKDVCQIVTAAATHARLRPGVTARTLRHSFATHLMDRGVDLAIIASLMGHRSPQETGVYLHVLPQRPEAAVRTLRIGEQP